MWTRNNPADVDGDVDGLTENDGPSKLQDMKLQDMKKTDQVAWREIGGHEIARHETGGQTTEK